MCLTVAGGSTAGIMLLSNKHGSGVKDFKKKTSGRQEYPAQQGSVASVIKNLRGQGFDPGSSRQKKADMYVEASGLCTCGGQACSGKGMKFANACSPYQQHARS
eukprot:1161878-Pelagomonas_calceolata.AAC.4